MATTGLVVPDCSEVDILQILRNKWMELSHRLILHLYRNDYTPTDTDICPSIPAFPVFPYQEANFTGYFPSTLSNWGNAALYEVEEDVFSARIVHSCVRFTSTSGLPYVDNDIHGYYVTYLGDLVWAEEFDEVFSFDVPNRVLGMEPEFIYSSEF